MVNRRPLRRIAVAFGQEPAEIEILRQRFPEIVFDSVDANGLANVIEAADAAGMGWIDPALFKDKATSLQWIQSQGAGVEKFIEGGIVREGMLLTNGSGVMSDNMAEHVIGMMLGFARCFPTLRDAQLRHEWKAGVGPETLFEIGGQTVVLVGMGDIAIATAKRLEAFGVRTIGVRRSQPRQEAFQYFDQVVGIGDLDAVLGEGHHVVSSVPHTPETRHLFNAERFARFRKGAYFYNVGRGTSVVQDDLIAALNSGHLGGAGLDVTDPEPLPIGHPLWDAPNVFLTGHTAGATPMFRKRLIELFGENIARYQDGRELINVVDVTRGY
jgi:phosphoglycerate dehydrogenase-like enzyme